MSEAFVDLLYRGLPLGSRARMSQFDAHHAYVELPAPMPVGTLISIRADGSPISAHVVEIHEQTAGSERPPGMRIRPVLDGEAKLAWWAKASGDPSVTSRAPDAPVAAAERPDVKVDARSEAELEAKPEAELEAKPEAELEAKPEAELEAKPEAELEAKIELHPEPKQQGSSDEPELPRFASPIIAPRMARADTDVEELHLAEPMDAQPEPAVAARLADELSGVELPGPPEPSASSPDTSPRGRKKRRPNRR